MDIPYTLIRSRRRTLSLIVERNAEVVVRAPLRMSVAEINGFLEFKYAWLKEKIAIMQERAKRYGTKTFEEGERFLYLGNLYPLTLTEQQKRLLHFEHQGGEGQFLLRKNEQQKAKELFRKWYRAQAKEIMHQRVPLYAEQMALKYNKIKINSAEYRWGSCTSEGNLNFTWRLAMAPLSVIDYVAVHELAHLIEGNHSARFWHHVSRTYPQYGESKKWLKEHGYLLNL